MTGLSKYLSTMRLGIQNAMEYRTDFIISIFSGIFTIIIQCFLWSAIYGSSTQRVIFGYTYGGMITYTIMAGVMSKVMSTSGLEWEISNDIKEGGLSKYIVQPISYFGYRISGFLGRKVVEAAVLAVISAIVLYSLSAVLGITISAATVFVSVLAVILAIFLNCIYYYCVSAAAFWMTDISAVYIGLGLLSTILSGGLFPLSIFGSRVLAVLNLLPFEYIIYYPLNILEGTQTIKDIAFGTFMQLFWIAALYLLSRLIWKRGMKRYISAGG